MLLLQKIWSKSFIFKRAFNIIWVCLYLEIQVRVKLKLYKSICNNYLRNGKQGKLFFQPQLQLHKSKSIWKVALKNTKKVFLDQKILKITFWYLSMILIFLWRKNMVLSHHWKLWDNGLIKKVATIKLTSGILLPLKFSSVQCSQLEAVDQCLAIDY